MNLKAKIFLKIPAINNNKYNNLKFSKKKKQKQKYTTNFKNLKLHDFDLYLTINKEVESGGYDNKISFDLCFEILI